MKNLKITLAAALLGTITAVGSAQAYTINATSGQSFPVEDLGTATTAGYQSTYTAPTDGQSFTFTGTSGVYAGNVSGVVASVFPSGLGNYLAAEPGGSVTVTFSKPQTALNLLWGSVDGYNSLTTISAGGVTISGADILAANSSLISGTSNAYVSITDLPTFDTVTFSSTSAAFEFLAGTPVNPVPEPLTLSLFGAGLAGLGFAKRRRKAKADAAA